MKQWILHIIILLTVALTSCTSLVDDEPGISKEETRVMFTLSMGESTGARARSSELGDGYENKIDVNNTKIVFYDEDNTLWAEVQNLSLQNGSSINLYHIIGELKLMNGADLSQAHNLKVVVLVNSGTSFDNQFSSLNNLAYNYPLGDQDYIPMWGMKSFGNIEFTPGSRTDLGTINLLRAIAKVHLTFSLFNCELTATPSFNRYNTSGACTPEISDSMKDTPEEITDPHLPGNVAVGTDLLFRQLNENEYMLYIPEYKNIGINAENKAYVQLKMKDIRDKEYEYNIDFKHYLTNTQWDILRNHYYKFNIVKSVSGNSDLTLEVRSEEYAGFELRPEYGD